MLLLARWGWLLACLAACAHSEPRAQVAAAAQTPVLVSSDALGPAMLLQQRLRGMYGGKRVELECVLQVSQNELTVIGMTPFGTKAFLLSQKGLTYHFEKYVDRELPFDPAHILDDVHRVFFRALPPGAGDVRTGILQGEQVTERWAKGVLVERRFERLDQNPPGSVRVTFSGARAPLVPGHVVIDNGWYGYRIEIDNLVQQSLP